MTTRTTVRWAGVAGTATDEPIQVYTGRTVGSLGLTGWDCRGDCTLTLDENREEKAWSFSVEPRITGVPAGGPADGILEAGDVIVAIEEFLITTAEGGSRIANPAGGAKRNGREETVTVVPEGREPAARALPAAVPEPTAVPALPETPRPASPAAPPTPPALGAIPAGLPLRYSGTLAGVEVRSEPVMVSSDARGTGTLAIYTDGLWIRVRVPPETRR